MMLPVVRRKSRMWMMVEVQSLEEQRAFVMLMIHFLLQADLPTTNALEEHEYRYEMYEEGT